MTKQVIPVEVFDEIAEEVKAIHEAMVKIDQSGLTRDALVVLLQAQTKLPKSHINYVLNALGRLDDYLK